MTIDKIGYTEKRIKRKEGENTKKEERKRYKKLLNEFNKKAEELKSPYCIRLLYNYPHLSKVVNRKLFFWSYKEILEITQLVYIDGGNYFVFSGGLDFKTFKDVEEILNNISIKFEVKLKSGTIPVKYKILEELGK